MSEKNQNREIRTRFRLVIQSSTLSDRKEKGEKEIKTQKLDGFRGFEKSVFVFASLSHI